jgi:peptidoglycan glycosyltransferase
MNKPLRRVAVACLALFALLLLNANYQQFVLASERRNDPANRRVLLEEYSTERGPILVAGQPIASSKATSDELKYQRVYANGPLYAPVTGFYSFIYGASGIESAERGILAGTDDRLFVRRVADLLTGEKPGGGSVRLTLNPAAQQAAYDGLQGQIGAVVAIAPQTGAILAMVTNPSYDPNVLSSHNGTEIQAAWQMLNADPAKPMSNRALRETYPPGSTFKIITAAAALSTGEYTSETVVPAPDVLDLPLTDADLPNQGGASCSSSGQISIRDALRISCNTAFGGLGMALGGDVLREQAEKFGFNSTVDVPMRSAESVFPSDLNAPQTAQSAIGQFDVRATPLQMAMMIAGVANDGVVMKPYLVQEVDAPDLTPLETAEPEQLSQAVTPAVAEQLQSMLVTVVQEGTGRNAQIEGVTVGGKTGTAQSAPDRPPYAWFVAFAPVENPQVAVAVLIESANVEPNDISGGRLAAPIAKAVMEAVLGS